MNKEGLCQNSCAHDCNKNITHIICCSLIVKVFRLNMNCKSRYKRASVLGYGKRVIVPGLFRDIKDFWYQRSYPGWQTIRQMNSFFGILTHTMFWICKEIKNKMSRPETQKLHITAFLKVFDSFISSDVITYIS